MSFKNAKRQILLFGMESSYGVDPTLVGANAMYVYDLNVTPLGGSMASRQKAHATFGSDDDVLVGEFMQLTFKFGLSGSGAAGTPPLWGPIARACGMSETITTSVKTVYAPISSSPESGAAYFLWDGLKHMLLGERGNIDFMFPGKALPYGSATFVGLFSPVTDAANPSGVETQLASWIKEIKVNQANTTFSLHSYAAVMESFQLNTGNIGPTQVRDRPNAAYVPMTDRASTGQVVFEAPPIATKDFISIAKAGTLGASQVVHGTTAGNIVQVDTTKTQLIQPSYSTVDGVLHLSSQLANRRTNGDDDFSITVK